MRVELILERMSSIHMLIIFLVTAVCFLANNLTDFLIFESFIDRYMLVVLTYTIVTLSLFIFSSSSLSFNSDAWMMETRE